MPAYIFFRKNEGWYIVEDINDEAILKHVPLNPGTIKVVAVTPGLPDRVVWEADKE